MRPPRPTRRGVSSNPPRAEFLIGGRIAGVWTAIRRVCSSAIRISATDLLFSNFRYSFVQPDGTWDFNARAENVGFRDQEFIGELRPNRQAVAQRHLAADPAVLQRRYDDAVYGHRWHAGARRRDAARDPEREQATLNAYIPLAPAFELRERRDIGRVDLVATPKPNLDVTANFTTQKHSGELPWGASFGFSNDVEVALPYDSRANDLSIGTEWTNGRSMLRVGYTGSWFDNIAPTLTWDSPLRLDDSVGTMGRDADACPSGRRTRPRPSASAATPSWRARRK